jgi:hypothetical protein
VRRNVFNGSDGSYFLIGRDESWMAAKTATNCWDAKATTGSTADTGTTISMAA